MSRWDYARIHNFLLAKAAEDFCSSIVPLAAGSLVKSGSYVWESDGIWEAFLAGVEYGQKAFNRTVEINPLK